MTSKRRHRALELGKDALMILLVLSAVWLASPSAAVWAADERVAEYCVPPHHLHGARIWKR